MTAGHVAATTNRGGIYAAACALVAAMYFGVFAANGIPAAAAVRGAIANVLPDALLGLIVVRLPRRLAWPGERKGWFFFLQAAFLIAFVPAALAGWFGLASLDHLAFGGSFRLASASRLLPWRALMDVLVYSALAGLSYAAENAAAGRREAIRAGVAVSASEPEQEARETPLRRLFARSGEEIVPIPVEQIRRVQANGDYVEVHWGGGSHLLHMSLGELAGRLDSERFQQVHRSHLINLDCVARLRPFDERRLEIRLKDGTEIVASRAASERLRHLAR